MCDMAGSCRILLAHLLLHVSNSANDSYLVPSRTFIILVLWGVHICRWIRIIFLFIFVDSISILAQRAFKLHLELNGANADLLLNSLFCYFLAEIHDCKRRRSFFLFQRCKGKLQTVQRHNPWHKWSKESSEIGSMKWARSRFSFATASKVLYRLHTYLHYCH